MKARKLRKRTEWHLQRKESNDYCEEWKTIRVFNKGKAARLAMSIMFHNNMGSGNILRLRIIRCDIVETLVKEDCYD